MLLHIDVFCDQQSTLACTHMLASRCEVRLHAVAINLQARTNGSATLSTNAWRAQLLCMQKHCLNMVLQQLAAQKHSTHQITHKNSYLQPHQHAVQEYVLPWGGGGGGEHAN